MPSLQIEGEKPDSFPLHVQKTMEVKVEQQDDDITFSSTDTNGELIHILAVNDGMKSSYIREPEIQHEEKVT